MSELMNIDPNMLVGAVLATLLVICFVALLLMVDFRTTVGRQYRVLVLCPVSNRPATVDVDERFRFGLLTRSVRRCSIREQNEGCDEDCLHELGRGPA